MDDLERYAAGVERVEVEAPRPSGVARARELGMEDLAPPKKKKQRHITPTEMKRGEIRALLIGGKHKRGQIASLLNCSADQIRVVEKLLKEGERQQVPAREVCLAVKAGTGRPLKRTAGMSSYCKLAHMRYPYTHYDSYGTHQMGLYHNFGASYGTLDINTGGTIGNEFGH